MRGMNLNVYLFEYNCEEISYQGQWKKELQRVSFFWYIFQEGWTLNVTFVP